MRTHQIGRHRPAHDRDGSCLQSALRPVFHLDVHHAQLRPKIHVGVFEQLDTETEFRCREVEMANVRRAGRERSQMQVDNDWIERTVRCHFTTIRERQTHRPLR